MPGRETLAFILLGCALAWIVWTDARRFLRKAWPRRRNIAAFEEPDGWSISFNTGKSIGAVAGGNPEFLVPYHTIKITEVQFFNLSKTYHRLVDVNLIIRNFGHMGNNLTFTTRNELGSDHIMQERHEHLVFPLNIQASGNAQGEIHFRIPSGIRQYFVDGLANTLNQYEINLICIDLSTDRYRQALIGEKYDAVESRQPDYRIIRASSFRASPQ